MFLGFRGFGAGPYSFVTTVIYTPKAGALKLFGLFGTRFAPAEKTQLDYWMKNVGVGAFEVISVKESDSDPHTLIYTVGSNNQALAESAIERIKPNAIKFSDIWYNTQTAIKEAASDVGEAAKKVTTFSLEVFWQALKPMLPYIIGGVIVIGGVVYTYGQASRKAKAYMLGGK